MPYADEELHNVLSNSLLLLDKELSEGQLMQAAREELGNQIPLIRQSKKEENAIESIVSKKAAGCGTFGIESPSFHLIKQTFLTIMGGGG